MRKERQWLPFQGMPVTKGSRHHSLCLDCCLPYEESDPPVCCRTEPLRYFCSQSSQRLSWYPRVKEVGKARFIYSTLSLLTVSTKAVPLKYFWIIFVVCSTPPLSIALRHLWRCCSGLSAEGGSQGQKINALTHLFMCMQLTKEKMLN